MSETVEDEEKAKPTVEPLDLSCYERAPKDGVERSYWQSGSGWKSASEFGCRHYKRNCKMWAECCEKWYVCRLCHDEGELDCASHAVTEGHSINRYETRLMKCMFCGKVQNTAQKCAHCDSVLGEYYCDVCKFWDNSLDKKIFHCYECHLCRVGLRSDFTHCGKCDACLHKSFFSSHTCVAKSLKSDCPVCGEFMHNSVRDVTFWKPCHHPIHFDCLEAAYAVDARCPMPHCRADFATLRADDDEEDDDDEDGDEEDDGDEDGDDEEEDGDELEADNSDSEEDEDSDGSEEADDSVVADVSGADAMRQAAAGFGPGINLEVAADLFNHLFGASDQFARFALPDDDSNSDSAEDSTNETAEDSDIEIEDVD